MALDDILGSYGEDGQDRKDGISRNELKECAGQYCDKCANIVAAAGSAEFSGQVNMAVKARTSGARW
jgi:hypothetical protein